MVKRPLQRERGVITSMVQEELKDIYEANVIYTP